MFIGCHSNTLETRSLLYLTETWQLVCRHEKQIDITKCLLRCTYQLCQILFNFVESLLRYQTTFDAVLNTTCDVLTQKYKDEL
jgi:hypothetical protein